MATKVNKPQKFDNSKPMILTVLGATIVAMETLRQTHGSDEVAQKMQNGKIFKRTMLVAQVLASYGVTPQAVDYIKSCKYWSNIENEVLLNALDESVNRVRNCGIWKFSEAELGNFNPPVEPEADEDEDAE